jgi:hypothetical protein
MVGLPVARFRILGKTPRLFYVLSFRCSPVFTVRKLGRGSDEPLATGSHQLTQEYAVLVWEGSDESARQVLDEEATKNFLDLHNAVRDRIYRDSFQTIGGSDRVWYLGSALPERSRQVRWFLIGLSVRRFMAFSAS